MNNLYKLLHIMRYLLLSIKWNIWFSLLLMAFLCLEIRFQSIAKGDLFPFRSDSISPLHVGDTIPSALWNLSLRVVNHPDGKDKITLDEYRDKKMIILDFWATWCGSCISSMPRLDSIARELSEDLVLLAVTTENSVLIEKFMRDNAVFKKLAPLSITNGSALSEYFPHSSIPHLVVIDSNGVVVSFTSPKSLNKKNLTKALTEGSKTWSEKFNYRHQVFPIESPYVSADHFYTVFSGYADGLESRSGMFADSLKSIKRIYAWNLPFNQFLTLALGRVAIPRSLIELQGGVDSTFFFNTPITYEATFPITLDKGKMEKYILHDIMRYTGYTGSLKQKDLECWVIYSAVDKPKSLFVSKEESITLRELVRPINNKSGEMPILIDEEIRQLRVIKGAVVLPLDFEAFRVFLNQHGLELRKESRSFTLLSVSRTDGSIE